MFRFCSPFPQIFSKLQSLYSLSKILKTSALFAVNLLGHAQSVRLAFVVMIHDLQPEVGAALGEGGADFRHICAPLPAEPAKHDVIVLVVLQPHVGLEPARPKSAHSLAGARPGAPGFRGWFCRTRLVQLRRKRQGRSRDSSVRFGVRAKVISAAHDLCAPIILST